MPLSIAESTAKVNPGYVTGDAEFRNNCFSAVTADLVNRANLGNGLNVVARPATVDEIKNGGMPFNKLLKTFKDSSIDDIIIKKDAALSGNAKETLSESILKKCGNSDGFGIIRIHIESDSRLGHFIKWEIADGKVIYSDSLSGSIERADKYLSKIGIHEGISRGIEFARIDGLEIDPQILMTIVKNAN